MKIPATDSIIEVYIECIFYKPVKEGLPVGDQERKYLILLAQMEVFLSSIFFIPLHIFDKLDLMRLTNSIIIGVG